MQHFCRLKYFETKYMKRKTNGQKQLDLFPDEDLFLEEHSHNEDVPPIRYDHTELFARLSKSTFRSSFHLTRKDKDYISAKGIATIRAHAADFIARRIAPAVIANDGRQTPMRGHPVFRAQHATGCCCRGCLYKWHHIPPGRQLTSEEQRYIVSVLMAWIERENN